MNDPSTLVIGGDSMIGHALIKSFNANGHPVAWTTREIPYRHIRQYAVGPNYRLNFNDPDIQWQPPPHIRVAYLCAGITSLDRCAASESRTVNVTATLCLARRLVSRDVFVIFPSSNLVFDGTTPFAHRHDMVCPTTVYGGQKAEVEAVLQEMPNCAIVRLTKVLRQHEPRFATWITAIKDNQPIRPLSDVAISPLPLPQVVESLRRIAEIRLVGITQLSADRDITYQKVAEYIARRLGIQDVECIVCPIASAHLSQVGRGHTTLDVSRAREYLDFHPPDAWSVIDWCCDFPVKPS